MKIQGANTGKSVDVDNTNRFLVRSVNETEVLEAVRLGDAYNINTGVVSIAGESALLYLKNNAGRTLEIEGIAIGLGAGTASDSARITIIRNPTEGTIVAGASGVSMNQNRNFGTNASLTADAYKGGNLATFTNGSDIALFFHSLSQRLLATVNFDLDPGNSIGIKIDPQLSSGAVNAYAAIICYLKPEIE